MIYTLLPLRETRREHLDLLWTKMVSDGTAAVVFRGEIAGPVGFAELVHSPDNHVFMACADKQPAAVCWLNRRQERWCQFHFSVFKEFWGHKRSVPLGRWTLRTLINLKDQAGYLNDQFLGVVPAWNRAALAYVRRCGGKECGRLPLGAVDPDTGKSGAAVLISLTREDV